MSTSPASTFDLSGQVALVTGSTKGIGRSIAVHMLAHGAKVIVSGRRQEACDTAARELDPTLQRVLPVACDIRKKDQIERLVRTSLDRFGRIDTLVCNAAVSPYYGPLLNMPDDAFSASVDGNLRSAVLLCNLVIPQMAERRDGAVILIGSIGAQRGSATIGLYSALKAADVALARCLAVEWGEQNIRVNCISPGSIMTDMAKVRWADPERRDATIRGTALKRIGEPDDIGGAAVFLASKAARYLTGQNLVIDGGVTITGG